MIKKVIFNHKIPGLRQSNPGISDHEMVGDAGISGSRDYNPIAVRRLVAQFRTFKKLCSR
jgi:hypothetical protein